MTVKFLPFRQQLVDPDTGFATREFWLFLQDAFDLSGTGAVDESDFALLMPANNSDELFAAISGTGSDLNALSSAVGQLPPFPPQLVTVDDLMPIISSLRDEIALLRTQLLGFQQGAIAL